MEAMSSNTSSNILAQLESSVCKWFTVLTMGEKNRINVLEDLSVVMLQAPLESGSEVVSLVVKLPVHGTSHFPSSTLTELFQRVG